MSAKELLQTLKIWEEKGVARVAPLSFEFLGNRPAFEFRARSDFTGARGDN